MEITQQVRDYARAHGVDADDDALATGMAEKSEEFREAGGDLYR